MIEEPQADARAAEEALALARQVGGPAAQAARRTVRRHLHAMGVAASLAVLASGLISRWGGAGMVWPRALLVGLIWGALFGAVFALVNAQPVRALPARRQTIMIGTASALPIGATMGIGADYPVAYPVGTAAVLGVWVLGGWLVGAARVRP